MEAKTYNLKSPIQLGREYELIMNFPLQFENSTVEMFIEKPDKTTVKFDSNITVTDDFVHYIFWLGKEKTALLPSGVNLNFEIILDKDTSLIYGTVKTLPAMSIE